MDASISKYTLEAKKKKKNSIRKESNKKTLSQQQTGIKGKTIGAAKTSRKKQKDGLNQFENVWEQKYAQRS